MIPRHMGQVQNQYALYLLYTRLFAGQCVLAGHHWDSLSSVGYRELPGFCLEQGTMWRQRGGSSHSKVLLHVICWWAGGSANLAVVVHQPTDGGGWTGWAIKGIRTFERDWVHKGGVAGVTGGRAAAT